jgi:hypothetical protein
MIATLEILVLMNGSAFLSGKVDVLSSPDHLQITSPPFRSTSSKLYVILGFWFSHPPLTGFRHSFLPPRSFLQSTSHGASFARGRSQKKLRLEKYSLCFHIFKHFPFRISTILAQTCSTFVRCNLNTFAVKARVLSWAMRHHFGYTFVYLLGTSIHDCWSNVMKFSLIEVSPDEWANWERLIVLPSHRNRLKNWKRCEYLKCETFEDSDRSPSIVFNDENRIIPDDHKHVYDRSDTKLNVSEDVIKNNWRCTFCKGKLAIKTVELGETCFSLNVINVKQGIDKGILTDLYINE